MDTIRFQAAKTPSQLWTGQTKPARPASDAPAPAPAPRRAVNRLRFDNSPATAAWPAQRRSVHSMHPRFKPVQIREVKTRFDLDSFIEFPFRIYAADKNWAPPLNVEVKAFLDRKKHPFYLHGEATQYLAYREGQVVGRILVSDDPHYNAEHGTNQGAFGMFECIDDQRVANALLNAAADWLRRRGRTEMMGPIDYSTNYPCGLLIDGFDTPQRVMMNHNPTYYAKLFEGWRLWKAKDLYAWWFDDSNDMLGTWARRAERLAERGSVRVRPVNFRDFDAEVRRCLEVYNASWEKSWGFVKLTEAEFRDTAKHLKQFAVPELIQLAEVDGKPVGFCVTLPDFNEATRPLEGRLTTWGLPIGLAKLLWNLRRIKTARMAVLGILPAFRRRGVAELFILKALEFGAHKKGYTGAELGWTLEDNDLINRTIERVGGRRYKTFRIYETTL
jgi:GNAT superfamily N-acetyltransferase